MVVSVRKDLPDEWEPIGGAVAQMMPDLRPTVENQNHELQKKNSKCNDWRCICRGGPPVHQNTYAG